jgi:putative flippase GtrA
MLLACKREGIEISEVPIETVYIEGNRASHFDPILDSMRIYFVLLRFFLASIVSAVVDNVVFIIAYAIWPNILFAQATGRVTSGTCNFLLNKKMVFQSKGKNSTLAIRYVLLVVFSGLLTYALIRLYVQLLPIDVVPAKIIAEILVFFINFVLQRDIVFAARPENGRR